MTGKAAGDRQRTGTKVQRLRLDGLCLRNRVLISERVISVNSVSGPKNTITGDRDVVGLIRQMDELIEQHYHEPNIDSFRAFVSRYVSRLATEQRDRIPTADLYGAAFDWWQSIQVFDGQAPKVRVFNTNLEEHGWLSGHTVVMVLQKDMPFLVDSLRIEIQRRNIHLHSISSTLMTVQRDENGLFLDFSEQNEGSKEALICMEINRHTTPGFMTSLAQELTSVLSDVAVVVGDYQTLLQRTEQARDSVQRSRASDPERIAETCDFLTWLENHHFTFLGSVEYRYETREDGVYLSEKADSRLGLFKRYGSAPETLHEADFNPGMAAFHQSDDLLAFTKSSVRSRVHRHAYSDYVVVKQFDDQGDIVGECRFMGLFTSPVYTLSPFQIPVLRKKAAQLVERSQLDPQSHDGKALRQTLETFPRDELLQGDLDQLYHTVMGATQINERHLVRLFMRRDPYGKFVSALVYVPRDLFNTDVRETIQTLIGEAIGAQEFEFNTYFSESLLARCHLVFRVNECIDYDVDQLQQRIVEITSSWEERFYAALCESQGEELAAQLYEQYEEGFSSGYRESYDPRAAVQDISCMAQLGDDQSLAMSFYQPVGASRDEVMFKVFHCEEPLELSDVIPVLENLGLRVIGEQPHRIKRSDGSAVWMHDFELRLSVSVEIDANATRMNFQEAFAAIWNRRCDNDAFNRLVLGARLSWREVSVLRAYAAYMKQTMFHFSEGYIANTLVNHLSLTRDLMALFKSLFDPRLHQSGEADTDRAVRLKEKLLHSLEAVNNLNEDRIIRRYVDFIWGTLRTNFYQLDATGLAKDHMSFKFSPREIKDIPEPRPMFEIFVFSPRMEGVHLRGGKVARGGLRWSDRLQDYRTEVLGLVKAQQVKNAVIVPNGAKGGFVCKQPPEGDRQALLQEGIACYKTFIRGLLDITDNIVAGDIKAPESVVRRDQNDPYLVVAADKGTATFSDIANGISEDYGHWLGDAFASGGSQGYDHKGMGITARGAWVSVRRHFKELGLDTQSENFSVVAIGDMGGDVFGNGMLLSRHIQLRAAFNHLHIFLDPDPDPEAGFNERQRLFEAAQSGWDQYDTTLISTGGGVFSRSAKSIPISEEMRQVFAIEETSLAPTELISRLLKAPVDLIWNGGIGTYVKSERETHAAAGDKSNDGLRVNGADLRCKVFGEGGNLGLTQLGRIEYCLNGGRCNTDFIDNAAGVDCSDHEVNIKILLDRLIDAGDLTVKQRNQLLLEMTDEVADLVLANNAKQTQAITLADYEADARSGELRRFMNQLVEAGSLNRALEFLPDDETLNERQQQGKSMQRPELSVLLSYAKVELKERLNDDQLASDPLISKALSTAFPDRLSERFPQAMLDHPLRRQIIATQVANDMVNHMGINFARRMMESTGSSAVDVAKAYMATREIYGMEAFFAEVESLDYQVDSALQCMMLSKMKRRLRRATRWFLRNRRGVLNPENEVAELYQPVKELISALPGILHEHGQDGWIDERNHLIEQGVPEVLATQAALPTSLYAPVPIIDAARSSESDPVAVAAVYCQLSQELGLPWFASQIVEVRVDNYWQAMAREAFLDDLESQMRILACAVMAMTPVGADPLATLPQWLQDQKILVERWRSMLFELQGASDTDYAMFSVALRELMDLAQASQHAIRC